MEREREVKRLSLYKDFTKLSRCQIVSWRWMEEGRSILSGEEEKRIVCPLLSVLCSAHSEKTEAVI